MAKKIIPIHFEQWDRDVLRRLAAKDSVSMAEVVRRLVRSRSSEVTIVAPPSIVDDRDRAGA